MNKNLLKHCAYTEWSSLDCVANKVQKNWDILGVGDEKEKTLETLKVLLSLPATILNQHQFMPVFLPPVFPLCVLDKYFFG